MPERSHIGTSEHTSMFEARIQRGATWKKILEGIKDFKNEISIECNEQGININAMDPAHVSLVSVYLTAGGFDSYKCEREVSMGVHLPSFSKIMKCADNDDEVSLRYEEGSDCLSLKFLSRNQQRTSQYELRLINSEGDHFTVPETEFDCTVRMSSVEFQRICRDLNQFGEFVCISCAKDGVLFSTDGELGKGNISLKQGRNTTRIEDAVTIQTRQAVSMAFPLRYLIAATKATPISEHVNLSLKKDMPLAIEYRVPGHGYLRFHVAPRLETEDNVYDSSNEM